ncbi:MAG: type I restriction endonuclease subunit R [Oscillospiraceae bacterium]|nr:type I restriction endonuclease subunit R [Oscillospiraceae bacterium]
MAVFNEDTRVKIPATIQYLRLGYEYQSLKDADIDPDTRIFRNRFKPAIEAINGRSFTDAEVDALIDEIHDLIKYSDLGKAFYNWLINPQDRVKLIDFDHPEKNDFAVVNELTFGKDGAGDERVGSFRPDINVLVNGIPLAFLEVKKPNNEGGIQAEFNRMLNKRLDKPEYKKYFNMIQIVSFSNNMEYEDEDDTALAEDVKAGSFYTTPNGQRTSFSFFREEQPKTTGFVTISMDRVKAVLKDNHYSPTEADTPEFQTNLDMNTPCNRFVTSMFEKERFLYFIHYGLTYVKNTTPEKHIMRYPQFFASKALLKRLDNGGKSGIIWHTQGSGKTALAAMSSRILRDYYAEKGVSARFYYVVDRLDLLTQVSGEMTKRGLNVINVNSKSEFEKELNKPVSDHIAMDTDGEITVVNIQKFDDEMPVAKNAYEAKTQRVIFVDEAHRSYKADGEFFKNLMLVDTDAVYVALTGTPLLSKKERSNLKFGDYIHKYFYDKSIADGYTLRIKKESIETTARAEIKKNLELENPAKNKADVYESEDYIQALCKFIEKDFSYFRLTNTDDTIGGMIVCASNPQAKKIKRWFDEQSKLSAGLVISDEEIPSAVNKSTQIAFKETLKPDILVVHQMLTTGYDVNRLKKMYLLRNAKEHTLLQTISRVNRPYKSPNGKVYQYGYIVDFVDIAEEYDRTIEMYLKEIESDFGEDGEDTALTGLIIGPDDINAKYQKYVSELESMIDTANLERFSKQLTFMNKDALLTIRRLLNGIKACHTEFKLSRADAYAAQIDIEHTKKLLKAVQARIDFVNLRSTPTNLLSIISNKDVVDIIYEFLKTKIEILDLGKLIEAMSKVATSEEYGTLTDLVTKVQNEIKKNRNHNQIEMIKLDELLQKLFDMMDIGNLADINEELRKILEEARRINEENERLSARYDGNYAFVKTYTDAVEIHSEYDKEDIAAVLDIVYEAVKEIKTANILILQGRDNFVSSVSNKTITKLIKAKLYGKLALKNWYSSLLTETYANMKMF